MSSDSDDALEASSIFQEPEDFYPPESPPTFAQHTLLSGQTITLRLVGHNPLWVRKTQTYDFYRAPPD